MSSSVKRNTLTAGLDSNILIIGPKLDDGCNAKLGSWISTNAQHGCYMRD
jgi:hypothetical protein